MQQTRTRNARPYAVEENGDKKTLFPLPSQLPIDEYFSRNADVTNTPDVKYATQKTRGEISLEVNRGFLSGRFLGYSLREFGLRRPLEMTY